MKKSRDNEKKILTREEIGDNIKDIRDGGAKEAWKGRRRGSEEISYGVLGKSRETEKNR